MKNKKNIAILLVIAMITTTVFGLPFSSSLKGEWGYMEDGLVIEAFSFNNGKFIHSSFVLFGYLTVKGNYKEKDGIVELTPLEIFDHEKEKWEPIEENDYKYVEPTYRIKYVPIGEDILEFVGATWGEDEPLKFKTGSFMDKIQEAFY